MHPNYVQIHENKEWSFCLHLTFTFKRNYFNSHLNFPNQNDIMINPISYTHYAPSFPTLNFQNQGNQLTNTISLASYLIMHTSTSHSRDTKSKHTSITSQFTLPHSIISTRKSIPTSRPLPHMVYKHHVFKQKIT